MLFILAMDPLQRLLDLATEHVKLSPLPGETTRWRTLLYAYDAAIFLNQVRQYMQAVVAILQAFRQFSGHHINPQKSFVHPVRSEDIELDHVLEPFNGGQRIFPLPLPRTAAPYTPRPLRKVHVQPLIERIAQRLLVGKGSG
jgi:hypothetical protein